MKAHKTVLKSKEKFNIKKSMKAEIDLLASIAKLPTAFHWDITIRHDVPIDYYCTVPGEICLTGCGTCFLELKL